MQKQKKTITFNTVFSLGVYKSGLRYVDFAGPVTYTDDYL